MGDLNALQWDGGPGHYEVYYLTLTDPVTGTGLWIRLTMRSPDSGPGECSLWFLAMTPDGHRFGRKENYGIDRLVSEPEPFRLAVADAELTNGSCTGHMKDIAWDLRWTPRLPAAQPVHPVLKRAKIARTIFVVPHPDVSISGTVAYDGRTLEIDNVPGNQAHLYGSQHASRWAWTHCNDFATQDGERVTDTFFEGVSVFVPRFGRDMGPNTPIVARIRGEDMAFTGPIVISKAASTFGVDSWETETSNRTRKLVARISAPMQSLVGVTYHDPDGREAYCYNSEAASMTLEVWDRTSRGNGGWKLRETLVSDGRAHFEHGLREKIDGMELHTT